MDKNSNQQRIHDLMLMLTGDKPVPEIMGEIYRIIENDIEARDYYIRHMHLHSAVKVKANESRPVVSPILRNMAQRELRRRRFIQVIAAMAPVFLIGFGFLLWHFGASLQEALSARQKLAVVAYHDAGSNLEEKSTIHIGQVLFATDLITLRDELVELKFQNGARVVLKGPAEAQVIHASRLYLKSGEVVVEAPPTAKNFTVELDGLDVVDLGTRFGVKLKSDGQSEVHVFDGKVELASESGRQQLTRGQALELDSVRNVVREKSAGLSEFQSTYPVLDGIESLEGQISIVDRPPSDVTHGAWVQSNNALVYREREVELVEPCKVSFANPGVYEASSPRESNTIAEGVKVSSFMLHFNTEESNRNNGRRSGSVTFQFEILGIICDETDLDASDNLFGLPSVAYPSGYEKRGACGTIEFGDVVELLPDRKTINFSFQAAGGHMDTMRVLVRSTSSDTE
ncbi:FecR domain-containing protein [Calycomorphotria hydatis]|uniref:FecR protein n=1 Tax=Calycomorphotria hydatis TaxID=2528027 RepID=A0A517T9U0_9PLAN|nr:FecR family protein [Calycomorphotria hydatis]QDT65136.1 FecR protein [Calycomorphotria hydatis]